MILIITSKTDSHIGAVTKHIDKSMVSWARINTEDLANNVDLVIEPALNAGSLHVKDSGITIDLEQVDVVWYRKPDPVVVSHFELDPGALDYVEAEFNEILMGIYALLKNAYWINDPFSTRIAHRKLLQLKTAVDVGFKVPKTLVTNVPAKALDFVKNIGSDVAIKSLGAITITETSDAKEIQYGIFTRRISYEELNAHQKYIAHLPTLFQEFISKMAEYRITVVGDKIFPCQILPPREGGISADDCRFDIKSLHHSKASCPELIEPIRRYMKTFGLNFGCFDFVKSDSGEFLFLENNPNGQWLWVEKLTGMPIAQAIANNLLDNTCRHN